MPTLGNLRYLSPLLGSWYVSIAFKNLVVFWSKVVGTGSKIANGFIILKLGTVANPSSKLKL